MASQELELSRELLESLMLIVAYLVNVFLSEYRKASQKFLYFKGQKGCCSGFSPGQNKGELGLLSGKA